MDFGKMKDELGGQAGDKVREELLEKVEEVKADIKGRFGQIPGGANLAPDSSPTTEPRNTSPRASDEDAVAADKQTTEDDETKDADDARAVAKAPEAEESESDDSAEEVA